MDQKLRASAAVVAGIVVCCGTGWVAAAQPKVPALPKSLDGYVKYAITDLPDEFRIGAVAATNNTPANNQLTDDGATLGRVLFYDTRLSHTDGVACASCHKQSAGFSDTSQFSMGVNGVTSRHSMGLSNATYFAGGKAFWDVRADSLEAQALVPIQNSVEMGSTLDEVIGKLNATTFYPQLFKAAFGTTDITSDRISKAIAQFERSMVSYKSKYDTAFTNGNPNPNFAAVFTAQELQGEQLFHGAGRCGACHATNAHVSDTIHNNGLNADDSTDPGAGNGKFKAPSLRNVAVRGEFMHDGRFSTLQQVINFYNAGVQNSVDLDPIMRQPLRLNLTQAQINALVAYLNTLTDNAFLTDAKFSDPFVTLPGDYNGDGAVDAGDYDVWRANLGDTTLLTADGNGDGRVDSADFTIWQDNMGATWSALTGAGSGSGGLGLGENVPEPGGLALAMIGLLWGAALRNRAKARARPA